MGTQAQATKVAQVQTPREWKKGVYQLLTGNKLVKVAPTLNKLKRKMRSHPASHRTANGEKQVNIATSATFVLFTRNNQEGVRFKAEEYAHVGNGYVNKLAKKKLGARTTTRVRLLEQKAS